MTATVALRWPPAVGYDPLAGKPYADTGLGQALADYIASKRSARRAPKTISDKEMYLGDLARMFPAKGPRDFTAFDVMHWEATQDVAPESLRTRRSHARDFFQWCVKWDICDRNPIDRLEAISLSRGKVYDIYTDAEVETLCELPGDGVLLEIMFKAGLRRSECCRLQDRHVLPEPLPGQLSILGGKGNKDRLVPLRSSLARRLAEYRLIEGMAPADFFWYRRVSQGRTVKRERQIGEGSFQRWWDRVHELSGVRQRNPHMTRHSFATRWLRHPHGRLETLSIVMGHSSIATTKDQYGHLDMRDVLIDMAAMED